MKYDANTIQESNQNIIERTRKMKKIFKIKTLSIGVFIFFIFFVLIIAFGLLLGKTGGSNNVAISNKDLSETTLRWQNDVIKEAKNQGVPHLVPYILAIIEVESKGTGPDIMQSAESAGLGKNGFSDPKQSINQGIKHLKNCMVLGESLGVTDIWSVIQSYNFGTNYISYLATQRTSHSVKIAEEYSRKVVAPSLGNNTGAKYSYVNSVSQSYGKTYLYRNGGNFFYAELIKQYVALGSSDIPLGDKSFQSIIQEVLKYEGNPYVWGGSNPSVGFDCSGLTQWAFKTVGISLPRTAKEQWVVTEKVELKDAKPGDLIFFKGTYGGPHHISHVGIYIDELRMYDSNGSGVGYHYWTSNYWISHFDSIRRVVK